MQTIKVAVTGFGNVGRDVATLILENSDQYESHGFKLILTGVTDTKGGITNKNGLDIPALLQAKKEHGTIASIGEQGLCGDAFLEKANADVLIEATSTNFENAQPGWDYIQFALNRAMKVVIASKGALVLYWDQIVQHSKSIRFSGAVGAPLPIFELRDRMLVGSTITGFEGILNATTNVILEAMDNGHTYEQGVKIAQDQGCAETDPTLDVDGWDASAKAVILANSILGANLKLSDVDRSSMRGITREEIQNAKQNGKKLKYIAGASKEGDQVKAWARAEQRDLSDALGGLSGGDMGVILKTDNLGSVAATNRELGDGGTLTALTCLRDVINLLKDTR